MIEAELKARVRDPVTLRARLAREVEPEASIYHDTYYDRPGGDLTDSGQEIRLRIVDRAGHSKALLTYKEPAVDIETGSKPEHETTLSQPAAIDALLRTLGLEPVIAFEKHCANYRYAARGRALLATLVTVPEIDGTFIELETMVSEDDMTDALADLRAVLRDLGVDDSDLTTEQYTEAVAQARFGRQASQ